jgi:putative membrane protein
MLFFNYSDKTNIMKTSIKLCLAAATLFVACNADNRTNDAAKNDAKEVAEEHNEAKFDKANEKDAQFAVDAMNSHLTEIRLAELAMEKAIHPEVKKVAKMIADENQKATKELRELAVKKNISLPESIDDNAVNGYTTLNSKDVNDFDKAFCDRLVEEQKKSVERYDNASQDMTDADLRNYAASHIGNMRLHLDSAMNIQRMSEEWVDRNRVTTRDIKDK